VGIIGAGGIATAAHIPGYQACGEAVELYAVCDVLPERAQKVAAQYGFRKVFTDFKELVADPALDVVSVCTPPFAHLPATVAALEAGKHVLCEKPMARTAAECQQMIDAWRRARAGKYPHLKFTVGFQSRFGRRAQLLKRVVEAGELGEVYFVRASALRRRGIPAWGVFTSKAKNGGGPLIDIGVHALDLALWLMGHPQPATVFGSTYRQFGNRADVYNPWGRWDPAAYDVEDSAFALVKFAGGATLYLECSWALNIERSVSQTLLCGTEGGAQLEPFRVFTERHGALWDTALPERPANGERPPERVHTLEVQGFIRAIQEDTEPLVRPEEALMVSQIVDAIYASDERGTAVAITPPAAPRRARRSRSAS